MPMIQHQRAIFLFHFACILAWLGGQHLHGAVVTLQAAADTGLFERSPDNNLGGMTFMPIGTTSVGTRTRGLVRFDLASALPADATINAARLTVNVFVSPSFTQHTYLLHRLLKDWGEGDNFGGGNGTGTLGALANAGEASWRERFATQASWGDPGGEDGADYQQTPTAAVNVIGIGDYTFTSPALTADVQAWQVNSSTNFGWIIILENELSFLRSARRFTTSEAGEDGPRLTITYTVPLRIEQPTVVDGQMRFQFQAEPETAYEIWFRPLVDSGTWESLTNIPAQAAAGPVHVIDPITGNNRFYRVEIH